MRLAREARPVRSARLGLPVRLAPQARRVRLAREARPVRSARLGLPVRLAPQARRVRLVPQARRGQVEGAAPPMWLRR